MHKYIQAVRKKAALNPKRIVFPEGTEARVLKAVEEIVNEGLAHPILIGNPEKIKKAGSKLKIDWSKIQIIDPETSPLTKKYAITYYELRKHKGITPEKAANIVKEINYFGTMMVHEDDADGMVSGTTFPTADTIRPALQILRTKDPFHKVSGVFFMILEERLLLFADAAITVDPEPDELAHIAIDTAETAIEFGIRPKVALLSFSTFSSADHPYVDQVKEALKIVRSKRPDLIIDGEMQVDAALVPEVAKIKCPKSQIQGDANVLIFPSLEAANIAYKLVERLAKAQAIGPLLQGLQKPINDLSRGCSYEDIVNVTAFTVCDCKDSRFAQKPIIL